MKHRYHSETLAPWLAAGGVCGLPFRDLLEDGMKPDWKDAPEWVRWVAMQPDGGWFWFADKPELRYGCWKANPNSKWMSAPNPISFEKSLEPRP